MIANRTKWTVNNFQLIWSGDESTKICCIVPGPLLFSPLARRRYKGSQHFFILINNKFPAVMVGKIGDVDRN